MKSSVVGSANLLILFPPKSKVQTAGNVFVNYCRQHHHLKSITAKSLIPLTLVETNMCFLGFLPANDQTINATLLHGERVPVESTFTSMINLNVSLSWEIWSHE